MLCSTVNPSFGDRRKALLQNLSSFFQRLFDQQFSTGIENVKRHVNHGHLTQHVFRHFLRPRPLLQLRERQRLCRVRAPGQDFSIQNQRLGKSSQRRRQLRKSRLISSRVRENSRTRGSSLPPDMYLRAYAVILVFYRCARKVRKRFLGVLGRAGQHESNGMEKPHLRLIEFVLRPPAAALRRCRPAACSPAEPPATFSSKAFAIASSTRLSRKPMRRSPLMILITYLASSAVARLSKFLEQPELCEPCRRSRQFIESRSHFAIGQ